jgi:hypothetical protein
MEVPSAQSAAASALKPVPAEAVLEGAAEDALVEGDTSLDLPSHLIETDRLLRTLSTVAAAEPPEDLCDRTVARCLHGTDGRPRPAATDALTSLRRPL